VLGAERVKFRAVPLEGGPPGDDGEFKAGILPLESDDYFRNGVGIVVIGVDVGGSDYS